MEFADLFAKDKAGKVKVWKARVFENAHNIATAEIQHGILNGSLQTATREYTVGKNIGKKNETTPIDQAIAETKRKWQDKQDKEGYSALPSSSSSSSSTAEYNSNIRKIYPMLAHTYKPKQDATANHCKKKSSKNEIVFPCYVQPKLDGLRCICQYANGKLWMQSRTGSYFENLDHLYGELSQLFESYPGIVLDGELYTTEMPFEELAGLIKKKKFAANSSDAERIARVKYHLYDCILPPSLNHHTFESRFRELEHIFRQEYTQLRLVETVECETVDTFRESFSKYVQQGFEGIMLRNRGGQYCENYRSHDLQKYKEFVEDEFEIVGYTEGDGRDKGAVIWICRCKSPNTHEFNVRPKGTMEHRRQLFLTAENYVGKMLTVIYQELSEYGVPRFPVGKAVREDY